MTFTIILLLVFLWLVSRLPRNIEKMVAAWRKAVAPTEKGKGEENKT